MAETQAASSKHACTPGTDVCLTTLPSLCSSQHATQLIKDKENERHYKRNRRFILHHGQARGSSHGGWLGASEGLAECIRTHATRIYIPLVLFVSMIHRHCT